MTEISTKRNLPYCAVIIFFSLFFCAIGIILLIIFFTEIFQNEQQYSKAFGAFMLISLGIYMIYNYWRNAPKATIDKHTIKIGKQIFYIKEITEIKLSGKQPFYFLIINELMEGIALSFNDGTEKVLFDVMYSNHAEIKLFLEKVVLNKQEYIIPLLSSKIDKNKIRFQTEETFKGYQFFNLTGILFWGMIALFIFPLIVQTQPVGMDIFVGVFAIFLFIFLSWQMHYFGVTEEYLIVRNHNYLWMKKIYSLSDIKEVVFEQSGRSPNGMRVITLDYRNKRYFAASLRDKTWLKMKKRLEEKGVKVRNECIYENEKDCK